MSRQVEIVEVLQTHGFQGVNELAARFDVTTSTIRRDSGQLVTIVTKEFRPVSSNVDIDRKLSDIVRRCPTRHRTCTHDGRSSRWPK